MSAPPPLDARSRALRRTIVQTLAAARRGHLGSALSLVEILRVLYDDVLRYEPARPDWPGRDRCILSKGHGCLALYAVLADKGFFPREELDRFCALDGRLGGHPTLGSVPGVEATTGSLGHGLSIGIGLALHARTRSTGARVFVVLGDGECDEGSVWEAALCAAKHKLEHLTALVDVNRMQSFGPTAEVVDLEPFADKWRSFGFAVQTCDGHDVAALRAALGRVPFTAGRPSALLCDTVKGKGVPFVEHDPTWHHKSRLQDADLDALLAAIEEPPGEATGTAPD